MRRTIGNVVSSVVALVVAAVTIWTSLRYLKEPQIWIDYMALIFSALTTGIVAFFTTWGHFQKEPVPELPESAG